MASFSRKNDRDNSLNESEASVVASAPSWEDILRQRSKGLSPSPAVETFPQETVLYLLFAGLVQAVAAAALALFFFPIARHFSHLSLRRLFVTYLYFNVFLLLWGCLGNYAFLSLSFGKLYVSIDRVLDWSPLIPFGQWVLNQALHAHGGNGYLVGDTTLGQLRLLWAAVAVPVWFLAYASTVFAVRTPPSVSSRA